MRSTSAAPERILAFGNFGSGKSHSWATTAAWHRRFGSDARFYVIGTEAGAVDRLSDAYPDFADNVTWEDATDWMSLVALTDKYLANAVAGDWIVVEGLDKPWDWVQQLWIETRDVKPAGSNPFELALGVSDVEVNWAKVNAVYYNWTGSLLRSPAHVFACCPQEPVRIPQGKKGEWADDKATVEQFGRFGYRPAGQKRSGHLFHTVLWMQNRSHREWRITSVDDHTRELLVDAPVADFVNDYLRKVARWEFDAAELTALLTA